MKPIANLSTIISNYDALLLDLWGVVHDGSHLYPGVHETLTQLKKAGKKIIMLSNAPRRADAVEKRLNELGIGRELYDGVLSSGEEGYQWLAANIPSPLEGEGKGGGRGAGNIATNNTPPPTPSLKGRGYYYIGPSKDADILNGLDYQRVDDIKQADFLLNVGFGDDNHPLDEFAPLLRAAKGAGLPMLCLNPDLEVVKISGEHFPCAGAIAKQYEQMGGQVEWFGKPYPAVYERCMEMLGNIPKKRVLVVGDSLETDIPGAQKFGMDSILVTGGLLKDAPAAEIAAACKERALRPTYVMPGLVWEQAKPMPSPRTSSSDRRR